MTSPTLVRTPDAAALLDMTPAAFRAWAHRHGLRPARRRRVGRSTVAWWDVDEVYETEVRHPRHTGRITAL